MLSLFSWILLIPIFLVSLLPLRVHYLFSDLIAWLLRNVFKYRTGTVYTNLARSFPELNYMEIKNIAKEYYFFMSDVICETIWGFTRPFSRVKKKGMFSVENMEILENAYKKHGTVVVLISHAGNWEMFSGIYKYADKKPDLPEENGTFAYHPMSSKLSEILFRRIRVMHHTEPYGLMQSSKILRFVMENKNKPWFYFFNSDQYPGNNAKFSCKFLNQETTWVNGGEAIARKLGTPVVYIYTDRVSRGKYVIRIMQLCEDASLTEEGQIMTKYAELLEKDIQNNKPNWLWSHKRWKNNGMKNVTK